MKVEAFNAAISNNLSNYQLKEINDTLKLILVIIESLT